MVKYIEYEAAIKAADTVKVLGLPQWNSAVGYTIEKLKSIPAADVKPVVRGKWEIKKDLWRGTAFCNQCNYAYSMGAPFHEYPPNYCPNCGAIMGR